MYLYRAAVFNHWNDIGDKYREQIPKAAPEQHGCDKVDCSEETGYEDPESCGSVKKWKCNSVKE